MQNSLQLSSVEQKISFSKPRSACYHGEVTMFNFNNCISLNFNEHSAHNVFFQMKCVCFVFVSVTPRYWWETYRSFCEPSTDTSQNIL